LIRYLNETLEDSRLPFILRSFSFSLHHSIKCAGDIVVTAPITLGKCGIAFDLEQVSDEEVFRVGDVPFFYNMSHKLSPFAYVALNQMQNSLEELNILSSLSSLKRNHSAEFR
jgi:hypothetical protein